MDHLYFRTEASASIGLGHVMRCSAIAEEARRRAIPVTFLLNETHPAVAERLATIGAEVNLMGPPIGSAEDAAAIRGAVTAGAALVLDSYAAGSSYLEALDSHLTLTLLDDLASFSPMLCKIVVNASLAAFELPYDSCAPNAKKLLGPDYAQIRREFLETPTPLSLQASIAIMFGGSDPKGYTVEVARRFLEEVPDLAVKIVAGPAIKSLDRLSALAERNRRIKVYASPQRVANVLAGSSLVITAAGGSVGEIAAMGLMALVMVVADNQQLAFASCPYPVLDGRDSLPPDLVEHAQSFLQDTLKSTEIGIQAKKMIDGRGCERILDGILASV